MKAKGVVETLTGMTVLAISMFITFAVYSFLLEYNVVTLTSTAVFGLTSVCSLILMLNGIYKMLDEMNKIEKTENKEFH